MNPKRKIYTLVVSFGIISILLIIFVLVPLFRNIQKYSVDLVSQKKDLALLEKEIETFNETRSLFDSYRGNINETSKLFYDPDNPLEFLNFLTKNPESYGIKNEILKMTPNVGDQFSPWPSISFQVSSTGSFANLMKFLKNLESGPYLIEISSMNAKKLTEDELRGEKLKSFSSGDVSAALLLKVYSK